MTPVTPAALPDSPPSQSLAAPPSRWNELRRLTRRLLRNPLSLAGLIIAALLVILALTASQWIRYPEDILTAKHMKDRLTVPGREHWFGTDELGRDIFSRVMVGTALSLQVGVIVVALSATVGTAVGLAAGYFGGWVDQLLMRISDGFLAFPSLVLALAVAATLGPSLVNAMLAITVVWWPWYARLVRAQALWLRGQDFVDAARALGASDWRIVWRHILPNCLVPIVVEASLDFGYVVLTAASLSYIGLGAQRPQPEWGLMVSEGRKIFPDYWWVAVFPGLAIFVTVLAFNLLGDGLREVMDPRLRHQS
jgi:peptide/nickel transport system permease protein